MGRIYKNVGGSHETADKVMVPHGGTIVSDEDLSKKFVGVFVAVAPEAEQVVSASVSVQTPAPVVTNDEDTPEQEIPQDHTDVTADFPEAIEGAITVTRNKAGWWFYDGDPEPVNDKPLKKKEVGPAITEYLGA